MGIRCRRSSAGSLNKAHNYISQSMTQRFFFFVITKKMRKSLYTTHPSSEQQQASHQHTPHREQPPTYIPLARTRRARAAFFFRPCVRGAPTVPVSVGAVHQLPVHEPRHRERQFHRRVERRDAAARALAQGHHPHVVRRDLRGHGHRKRELVLEGEKTHFRFHRSGPMSGGVVV